MTTIVFMFPIGKDAVVEVHKELVDYDPQVGSAVYPHTDDLHGEYEVLYRVYRISMEGKKRVAWAKPAENTQDLFIDNKQAIFDYLTTVYGAAVIKVVSELDLEERIYPLGGVAIQEITEEFDLLKKIYMRAKKEFKEKKK